MTLSTPIAAPGRARKTYPLRDLGVAPENMRFGQPPDEDIPQLAATLKAAGQLQPITVRPGRRKEKPAMALDGRRRLMALELLRAEGAIADDYPVEVFEETDPARQAAAVLLTNTAAPVHVADVIAAIGKMLNARLTPAVIAGALGYAEIEIRRLAALSRLEPRALQALKAGRLTLRQARLLARMTDAEARSEIVDRVLEGYAFPEHGISEALDAGRITGRDRRCALAGPARYAAAGGRIEADLFGERPEVWLDAEALDRAWSERAAGLAAALATPGLTVRTTLEPAFGDIEDLEPFGYRYGEGLDAEARQAWHDAEIAARAAGDALRGLDLAAEISDPALLAFVQARLAADRAGEPDRTVTVLLLKPSAATGVEACAYGPPAPAAEDPAADEDLLSEVEDETEGRPVPGPAPETEGVGHALHETRTDAATRVLARALADCPEAALVAVTARLFDVLILRAGRGAGGGASTLTAEAYGRPRARVIDELDGDVRRRLTDRRLAWQGSGLTTIAWVAGLAPDARMALLAELAGLSLDLCEARTTARRDRARGEAAELAALCDAEATRWWTPDAPFLRAHSKAQLLAMLAAMGADETASGSLKKEELVAVVAEQAAVRRWAPAWLSWRTEPAPEAADPEADLAA